MECELNHQGRRIRVLVADDTRIHTQLLAEVLKRDNGLHVSSCELGSERLVATAKAHSCDVLIISSNLDDQPNRGFEVLGELRSTCPEIRAVMLLDSSRPDVVLNAFRAGVKGIFSKHDSVDTLCKCVRSVYRGQVWADSQQMAFVLEALASSPKIRAVDAHGLNLLSRRELEVVRGLSEGLTNREIGERLGLSQHTVKNYLFRLFDKLGVSNRVELLFMTLSQETQRQSVLQALMRNSRPVTFPDDASMTECERAAERGVAAAQLALAQLYCSRNASAEDLVEGYMWYMIASEQISRTSQSLDKVMTADQLLEAKQKAADWLRRSKKIRPISVEGSNNSPPQANEASA